MYRVIKLIIGIGMLAAIIAVMAYTVMGKVNVAYGLIVIISIKLIISLMKKVENKFGFENDWSD